MRFARIQPGVREPRHHAPHHRTARRTWRTPRTRRTWRTDEP